MLACRCTQNIVTYTDLLGFKNLTGLCNSIQNHIHHKNLRSKKSTK